MSRGNGGCRQRGGTESARACLREICYGNLPHTDFNFHGQYPAVSMKYHPWWGHMSEQSSPYSNARSIPDLQFCKPKWAHMKLLFFPLQIAMHARERERKKKERERDREGKKETGQGRGEPTRREREKRRRDRAQTKQMLSRTCLDQALRSCRQEHRRKRKRTQAGPERRKGEEEGGRGEKKKQTRKPRPQRPENGEERTPISTLVNSTQKRAPRTKEHTASTKHGAQCPKPSGKTRRNKNRTPKKNKPKKGRTFFLAVFGTKNGRFWAQKIFPKKPRTPSSELAAKNSPARKPKTDRTLKNRKTKREGLRKNPRQKRTALPPKPKTKIQPKDGYRSRRVLRGFLGAILIIHARSSSRNSSFRARSICAIKLYPRRAWPQGPKKNPGEGTKQSACAKGL